MMMSDKIFSWLATAVICSLLLTAGCAPVGEEVVKPEVQLEEQIPQAPAEEAVSLALKFTPQDSTTYKIVMEAKKGVRLEVPPPRKTAYAGGETDNRLEMTFTQQIQSTDDKGNAVAKITINRLKYFSASKGRVTLDFDSSNPKDPDHPLAKLIGQSYTIKIAPTGEVTEVIDVHQAEVAARKGSVVPKRALRLLASDAIRQRHGTLVLPEATENQMQTGDNWNSVKTFSFGLMGSKSYEKIYALKEIKDQDNRKIAIVEMSAIPTSEMAEQLHKEQATSDISKMFDSTETYTGRLRLDLTSGKIEKYIEELQVKWVIADEAKQEDEKEPAALKMSAIRLYRLERID